MVGDIVCDAVVSSPLVGSPVEPVIPIRWEDDKPC